MVHMIFIEIALIWYFAFIFSIVIHEATHSFVGLKLGDNTSFKDGMTSLNPLIHIKREIWGTLVIPIMTLYFIGFTIGWASTTVDLNWAKKYPRRFSLMTLSGPTINLLIFIIVTMIIYLFVSANIFYKPDEISYSIIALFPHYQIIATILSIIFSVNLLLFFLNILPLATLDGAALFLLLLPESKSKNLIDRMYNFKFHYISIFVSAIIFILFFRKIHYFIVTFIYS